MTRHHAELDVEIEIGMLRLDPRIGRAAHRRLDEVAPVINVAAHHHPERAVGAAVGPHRGLVAVGGREHRKVRRLQFAVGVEIDRALGEDALPVDQDVLEAQPADFLLDQRERHARLPSRRLDPARQQILDLGVGQIGFDIEAARRGLP